MLLASAIPTSRCATGVELLAHRGLWTTKSAGNSLPALTQALQAGFGLETDFRDWQGELVIAHDPPTSEPCKLRKLLAIYAEINSTACLALNVKSCGLAPALARLIDEFAIQNYFVFDMSVPDTLAYARAGLRYFARHSELEPAPALYDQAAGIWLDTFHGPWFGRETIEQHLRAGKDVCVVSPELHGRQPAESWPLLREIQPQSPAKLLLCTDQPHQFASR